MSRVVVFGNGLDALLAVHAASLRNSDVLIYSNLELNEMSGPQILLAPIPMIEVKCASLSVFQHGDPDDFMHKLLNQNGAGRGPEAYDRDINETMIWDAAGAYQWLLETYARFITVVPDGIGFKEVRQILEDTKPDTAYSGIDRDDICGDRNHSFAAAKIVTMPATARPGNQILISGHPDDSWGMETHLFGDSWRHYGEHRHPPVSRDKLSGYIIPQGLSCDCHTEGLDFVGKLGAWDHKWSAHRSFYRPFAALGD